MHTHTLETERLILREYTPDDFDALYAVVGDRETMKHFPKPYDERGTKYWISWSLDHCEKHGFGFWAVILKETGELIGNCGLTMQMIDGQIKPEIGYHIRADKQRNGYAREAAIAVRDWTFCNTPFQIIYSYMKSSNEPSIKTAISYGCRPVDEFADEVNGMTKVYALSRDVWISMGMPMQNT